MDGNRKLLVSRWNADKISPLADEYVQELFAIRSIFAGLPFYVGIFCGDTVH